MKTNTMEPKREFIELRMMEPWARNPRGGELRGMEAFTEQMRMETIRDDVHVFALPTGRLTIMQGHRRYEAARRLGLAGLWAKVWPFDEADAFRHLLTMQNGGDPFDARELACAAREAIKVGIAAEELPGIFHRSAETVQLYLDLGLMPHRVQEAVHKGRLALGTAGLMRQLDKEQLEMALEGVLHNPLTNEPMSEAQARVFIENAFLKPKKQAKEWAVVSLKMKRKLMAEGVEVDVVAWEDRADFVTEGALPVTAYARCEEHIEDKLLVDAGKPMTWGELARGHGVPWHLCPAPVIEGRYLLLVKRSAVMDADDVATEGAWTLRGKAWRVATWLQPQKVVEEVHEEKEREEHREAEVVAEVVASFDERRWRTVLARLMARPEAAMQNGLWEPLMLTQWEALAEVLRPEVYAMMMGEMSRDAVGRKGLRWCLLACVARAMHEADEVALAEVETALGIV